MIHFDRLSWRFAGAQSWALQDVSLHIPRGKFVVIAGPSGSGKTTLALAMCGLLIGRHGGESEGSVHVAGQDVATTPLHHVAQTIGLLQQNPESHFATLTVSDEIAFGMENRCLDPDEIRRRSAEAMQLLSIAHLRHRHIATLSGGEKQRVAVASIVAGEPEALVLDEPSASLDPQASRDLFRALADLCARRELTVVIIEHKLAHLLSLGPRLVCLNDGRVERGDQGAIGTDDPERTMASRPVDVREDTVATAPSSNEPEIAAPPSPAAPGPSAPLLVDMSKVEVDLDGHTILDDVSLQVRAGEVLAV
ncbi:MAG: ABC transporter ATP-binding protein, partial [Planctomycetota bacterium]